MYELTQETGDKKMNLTQEQLLLNKMKTLTTFEAPEKAKFMFQDTIQGPVMWVVSDEGKQKLFRFRGKTIRDKNKKFKHMKYYLEEV